MDSPVPMPSQPTGSFIASLYAWMVTVLFGGTLLDVVYARAIRTMLEPARLAAVFSRASDLLLLVVALALLAALGAIAVSWSRPAARGLFVASALFLLAELLAPVVLAPLAVGPQSGSWIRLLVSLATSVAAFAGLSRLRPRA